MVDAARTIKNAKDVARVWPDSALAPNILKDAEGTATERITGPNGTATVKLSRPATKIRSIASFATATGIASTGGGKKQYLTETTDFTVNLADPNLGGVCSLSGAGATDYSAETWIVSYSPSAADGTVGGQSKVGH